jgi:hypothetical protein
MYRIPGPTDLTRRYQGILDGTLNRQPSVPPGPLRTGSGESAQPATKAIKTPRDQALDNVPDARAWVAKAVKAIDDELRYFDLLATLSQLPDNEQNPDLVRDPPTRSDALQHPTFKALQTHFHLSLTMPRIDSLKQPYYESDPTVWAMKTIRARYDDIDDWLKKTSIFKDAKAEGEGDGTGAYVPTIPERIDEIRITPIYSETVHDPSNVKGVGPYGPLVKVHALIHEATHLLDASKYQDWAYRGITKDSDNREVYVTQTAEMAMRNPDSYAYFALQIAKGIDRALKMYE